MRGKPATLREHHKAMDARIPRRPEWDRIQASRKGQDMATVIELPRSKREGSVTDEQVQEIRDTILNGGIGPREAIVIEEGLKKDPTARNRARAAVTLYAEKFKAGDDAARETALASDEYQAWADNPKSKPEDEPEVPAGFRPLRSHAVKVGDTYTAAVSLKPDN